MKNSMVKILCSIALSLTVMACSQTAEPPLERKFGTPFGQGETQLNLHAATTGMSACERLNELNLNGAQADGVKTFSYATDFSFEVFQGEIEELEILSDINEFPAMQAFLTTSKVLGIVAANDQDFLDMAKVTIRVKACPGAEAANWEANDGCAFEWNATLSDYGCALPNGAANQVCQMLWAGYTAKRGIGACAHVAEGQPAGSELCEEAEGFYGILQQLEQAGTLYVAKNLFLASKFRGMFGEAGAPLRESGLFGADKSLQFNLLNRVKEFKDVGSQRVADIVTAKTPLFPRGREWSDFAADAFRTLSAVKNSAHAADPQERICSMVLGHRGFAQMLALNGHLAPKLVNGAVPMLDGTNTIEAVPTIGTYLRQDRNTGALMPTVLRPEDLAGYNPANGLILATAKLPSLQPDPANAMPANLDARLDRMAGIEYIYEATSPAAVWNQGKPYLVGDIEDENGQAILPPQIHSLALGHIVLGFKNIAALNLFQIKADGSIIPPGDTTSDPAGIVLVNELDRQAFEGVMDARSVMKFSRMVLRLDAALENVLKLPAGQLGLINSSYSASARPGLMELSGKINALKLPLRFLLDEMLNNPQGCFSMVKVRLAPGVPSEQRVQPLGVCDADIIAEFEELKEEFAASLMPVQ